MKKCTHQGGFTLIELMITVVVATVLIAIAGPAYQTQVRKSRRTEAKTAILDLAGREERLFSTTNAYSNDPATLGYSTAFGQPIGGGYYALAVPAPGVTPPGFTITATAIGTQLKDTQCTSFTVDQTGKTTAKNSAGVDSSTVCLP